MLQEGKHAHHKGKADISPPRRMPHKPLISLRIWSHSPHNDRPPCALPGRILEIASVSGRLASLPELGGIRG